MTDEPKNSKTIKHKLQVMRNHPMRWLTQFCLLSAYDYEGRKLTEPQKACAVQRELRYQYYRMISKLPERRQRLTYCLNCRPTGFKSEPYSIACKSRRVCPWCFVRKLYDAHEELYKPESKIRNLHQLVAWKRKSALVDPLPFFPSNYGPHQWCESVVTVQIVVPFLDYAANDLVNYHVGFMVVPKSFDYQTTLKKRKLEPVLRLSNYGFPSSNNIVKALSNVLEELPWKQLFDKKQLDHFITLVDCLPGKRLLRVNRYKPKGESCGN